MGKLKTGLFTHIPLCIMIAIGSYGNFFPTKRCYIRIDVEVVLTDLKEVFTTTNINSELTEDLQCLTAQ